MIIGRKIKTPKHYWKPWYKEHVRKKMPKPYVGNTWIVRLAPRWMRPYSEKVVYFSYFFLIQRVNNRRPKRINTTCSKNGTKKDRSRLSRYSSFSIW